MRLALDTRTVVRQLTAVCALLAAHAPAQLPAPQAPNAPPAPGPVRDVYPPTRNVTLLHAFSIEGDVRAEPLRKAIAELGKADADARIVYGPERTTSRPGRWFLCVEAPATLKTADVAKAVKKGASSVDALAWTVFDGPARVATPELMKQFGTTARDWVLGLSNDLRWADTLPGRYQFYALPGKLDAPTLQSKLKKMLEPWGLNDVGTLVRDGFTWSVTSPIDDAAAKKLDKALEKLDGVVLARTDAVAKTLLVQFDMDGMRVCAPPAVAPEGTSSSTSSSSSSNGASTQTTDPPRARFDVNPVLDLLAKEKVTVGPLEKRAAQDPAGDDGGAGTPPAKDPPGG